ncbi:hypothetical protein GCM10017044_10010 [Kordiimonas sediminis]|uniref:Solute-binding protein family 3/N-terminal domain-containing protein n=2 Tax=Kordiimonas sediminis TaxID=1735581 RepID=A0A919APV3_9PROT|nr:hypothetical protein GCM10017044_10010 [Kordiimonas sediminis]
MTLYAFIRSMLIFAACLAVGFSIKYPQVQAQEPIEDDELILMYSYPASSSESEIRSTLSPSGAIGAKVAKIFDTAGINTITVTIPWHDQLRVLEANARPICGSYFIHVPEREGVMKFSDPIGTVGEYILIGRSDDTRIQNSKTLEELIKTGAKGVLPHKARYVEPIEKLLGNSRIPAELSSSERIIHAIASRSIDYSIFADAFTEEIRNWDNYEDQLTKYTHLPMLKHGPIFHIACSLRVDDAIISRLNAVIRSSQP